MNKNYYGVLTKEGKDFMIYSHDAEINFSQELKHFWQREIPLHIKIESNERKLMDENKCEIYYDRNANRQYQFHINGRNIEEILQKSIGKQLDITLNYKNGEATYGANKS